MRCQRDSLVMMGCSRDTLELSRKDRKSLGESSEQISYIISNGTLKLSNMAAIVAADRNRKRVNRMD